MASRSQPLTVDTVGDSGGTRVGFLMEYTLGHVTFAETLKRHLSQGDGLEIVWMPVHPDDVLSAASSFPLARNYTVALAGNARRLVRSHRPLDALVVHTQTLAQFLPGMMRDLPTVISLDATPRNLDAVADAYGHRVGNAAIEWVKSQATGVPLRRARHLAPWSEWAARSLTDDYGVAPDRVTVIRPGVHVPDAPKRPASEDGPLKLLFVGADFERKGGPDVLAAMESVTHPCELDIVTRSQVDVANPAVRVHRDISIGDERLESLYAQADVFVLPSRGEAYGIAICEAMAAGLPVVTTNVGAIPELVTDGVTGFVVAGRDPRAIAEVLRHLASDPERRRELGQLAHSHARAEFDERVTTARFINLVKRVADESLSHRSKTA